MNKTDKKCPCGSQQAFKNCCAPVIYGEKKAPTALTLMRSRYTAFTMAHVDYLMKSHHPRTRPLKEKKNLERWAKSVQWMGLVILNTQGGTANDSQGMVEFRAVYLEHGKLQEIHEKSIFERVDNIWLYVSGEHL